MTYILLIAGLFALVKGADALVSGSSSLAKKFGLSELMIGLTVVAFGTSAPELFVNMSAVISGSADIALGNVIGSNIANILLILGISAIITPLVVTRGTVWKEIPFALLSSVIVFVMASDILLDGSTANILGRADGIILLGFFAIFMYYTFGIAKTGANASDEIVVTSPWRSIGAIALGLVGLVVGGKLIVESATDIATAWGISQAVIGLTIVAVGTSLPELATSIVAAYRGNADIAIGNVVGSNIFNVFFILGLSSLLAPLPVAADMDMDIVISIGVTLVLFVWMFLGRRHVLERWQGIAFVALYIVYVISLVA